MPDAVAARHGKRAAELRPHRIVEVAGKAGAPVAAWALDRAHGGRHCHASQSRYCVDAHLSGIRIGHEVETDALVVEQQRVWPGVIRAQQFTVERAGVVRNRLECRTVEHQIAADFGEADTAQPLHQQPQMFDHQSRIACTPQV